MIDHLLGRPSLSWKRTQVFFVIIFWFWRILRGNPRGPRILWIRRANRALRRFTPWQLVVSTLTGVYAVRNLDKILGLGSPEPLANLYSQTYYRATWITTGLDAGFATAMSIRPKWLKDICSILFSVYYIVYANEGDEKLRRFRAVPTVEMLRTTWEKTSNRYIRMLTHFPPITIRRKILISRPNDSTYQRPILAWLFFAPPEHHLCRATDLIVDFPGGGFVSMTPEHHEERLRMWTVRTGKPVLSIEYGKAPEYPYPFAIDECFDLYRVLVECSGKIIGMSGAKLNVIFTGDSAGAHIAVCVMMKILETQLHLPHPRALVLNYPALDFNFTSWMTPSNLRVLQYEQSTGNIPSLAEQKDHFSHISPLSMVGDRKVVRRRRNSWREAIRIIASPTTEMPPPLRYRHTTSSVGVIRDSQGNIVAHRDDSANTFDEAGDMADVEDADMSSMREEDKPIEARVRFNPQVSQATPEAEHQEITGITDDCGEETQKVQVPLGTRLTMTSRTGYFQDRIISPSMMRAMAILYIGPHRNPEFDTDYYLSPILAPSHLLARFPPILMSCGEKDPFVDDTVIFAGRIREAKRARKQELDVATSGKSVKNGEHLRMSSKDGGDEAMRALKRERDRLASQSEDDWVRMHIFSEWSHGYLQMPMLMQEARTVINDLADWMDEVFATNVDITPKRDAGESPRQSGRKRTSPSSRDSRTPHPTDDGGTSLTSETELETDDILTFAPKKRTPPSSFGEPAAKDQAVPSVIPPWRFSHSRSRSHGQPSPRPAGRQDRAASLSPARDAEHPEGPNGNAEMRRFAILHDSALPQGIARDVNGLGSPPSSKRPSPSPGHSAKGGQTISESELMRRRRLLDAHLINSKDTVK
ncbi:Hormone-sensitive lipase [Grifola frondosa]|uniref:Hormone-sensitive lipase n=1 Tax=Grifola frondosa TaxID=5627 RepID=A0A1C7LWD0_GRIFR|nr:Hormone-sensitive lipase [Grifola frondosa]